MPKLKLICGFKDSGSDYAAWTWDFWDDSLKCTHLFNCISSKDDNNVVRIIAYDNRQLTWLKFGKINKT